MLRSRAPLQNKDLDTLLLGGGLGAFGTRPDVGSRPMTRLWSLTTEQQRLLGLCRRSGGKEADGENVVCSPRASTRIQRVAFNICLRTCYRRGMKEYARNKAASL